MAKKINQTFNATLTKNLEKGGGWMLEIAILEEENREPVIKDATAWSNPSAAKRYLKHLVLKHTPRKSIKMETTVTDKDTGKPLLFSGQLVYKVEA